MVDCRNCEFGGRPTYEWPCHICTVGSAFKPKPKLTTNADRIRAMSDEELVEVINRPCPSRICACGKLCPVNCEQCWLEWLQSPVEVEE